MQEIGIELITRGEKSLESLINTERDVFLMENNGQKNGYYSRSMKIQ